MIHLTLTGYYAGHLLCGGERDPGNEHVHAVYAPLHIDEYRARVCSECLKVYAATYEPDEIAALAEGHWVKNWARENTP